MNNSGEEKITQIKRKIMQKNFIITALAVLYAICFASSCIDEKNTDEIKKGTNFVLSLDWNESYSSIKGISSSDMNLLEEEMGTFLKYYSESNENTVSYLFQDDRLKAVSVDYKSPLSDARFPELFPGYSLVGYIEEESVFANYATNTILFAHREDESVFKTLGFVPLNSDLYEDGPSVSINTLNDSCQTNSYSRKLTGRVDGVDEPVEVGFQVDTTDQFSSESLICVSGYSKGKFGLDVIGLKGETKYYYRAYVQYDDIVYFGEIKSFTTTALKYSIDGKEFNMVLVDGGTMPPFYIMQTELPTSSIFAIGNESFGTVDKNNDTYVIYSEFCKFVMAIREKTGLDFRLPTSEEWEFAAQGGKYSRGYLYSGSNDIDQVGWYRDNSDNKLHDVAQKLPNELGLYDMTGNFSELCDQGTGNIYDVDGPSYGGNFSSVASSCKTSSYFGGNSSASYLNANLKIRHIHAYDANIVTFRLVYSK